MPFTVEEARGILDTAANVRNGARFVVALTLGFRRGEAPGLKWSDLDIKWRHGCEKGSECRSGAAQLCADRQLKAATMTIRRAVQQFVWQHGCTDAKPCGRKLGHAGCPRRTGRARRRAAHMAAGRGWVSAHVVDLLIYPLALVSAVMAVPAMAAYGYSLYHSGVTS